MPVYDDYRILFDKCDEFNKRLHHCTWPHKPVVSKFGSLHLSVGSGTTAKHKQTQSNKSLWFILIQLMMQNHLKKMSTKQNCMLSTATKRIFEANAQRRAALDKVYLSKFRGLSMEESLKLAKSGDVWWNHTGIDHFKLPISEKTTSTLSTIDEKSSALKGHVTLNDSSSPVWKAFRLAMTHHSTTLEGNQLNE